MVCVNIADAIAGKPNPPVTLIPEAQMNNWVGFDPKTWANIQAYIEKLKALAQQRCQ